MISINKYGKNIDLSKVVEINGKKSFSLDGLVANDTLLIKVPKGIKFKSSLVEDDVRIEFKESDGTIFELILKNMANLLAQNDGDSLVEIIEVNSDKVLASISDITSALEAAAAGNAENKNSDSAANSSNGNGNEVGLENRNYDNNRVDLDTLPRAENANENARPRNAAPIIEEIEAQIVDEDNTLLIFYVTSDANNDNLTPSVSSTNGTAVITEEGQILFTPNENFNGEAQITLSVSDGKLTTVQTINVTVNPINDQVIISDVTVRDFAIEGNEVETFDGQLEITIDPDLTDTHTFQQTGIAIITTSSVAEISDFSVVVDSNGVYHVNGNFDALADGETATITFTYTATDDSNADNAVSEEKTVTLTVRGTNDQAIISNVTVTDFAIEGNESETFDGQLEIITDLDITDTHTFQQTGIATITTSGDAEINDFLVVIDSDGRYHVNGNFDALTKEETAIVKFTYTVTDDSNADNAVSEEKTVTLTVTGTNDAPTLTSQVLSTTESDLTQADEALLDSLTFDANARDFSFSISNSTIVSLYESLNIENLIQNTISNLLSDTSVEVNSEKVNGTITLSISIPDYSGTLPVATILSQENLNAVLLDHLGSAFNLPLENAVYSGQIEFDDVDNIDDVTFSLGDITLEVTTTNKYLITLYEQVISSQASLTYIKDLASDIINRDISVSTVSEQTIAIPNTAVKLLQNSGLLTVSLDESTGEYKIVSPLFNTMKETDSIDITFEYIVDDTIADPLVGSTTLTITGTNDAPVAFDDTVTVEIKGSEDYEGTLPGAYNLDMLKKLNITTDLTSLKANIITNIKNNVNVNIEFTEQEQADILSTLKADLLVTTQDDIVTYLKDIIEGSLGTASNETSDLTLESTFTNFVISQDVNQAKTDILALYADKLSALGNIETDIEEVIAIKTIQIAVETYISTLANSSDGKPDIFFDVHSLTTAISNYVLTKNLSAYEIELVSAMTNTSPDLMIYLYTNGLTIQEFISDQLTLAFSNTGTNINDAYDEFITLMSTTIFDLIETTFTDFPDGSAFENSIKDTISTFTTSYYTAINDSEKLNALGEFESSMKNLLIANPLIAGATDFYTELTILENAVSLSDIQNIDQTEILASLSNSITIDSSLLSTLQNTAIAELKTYISSLTLSDLVNNPDAITDTFKDLLDSLLSVIDNTIIDILPTQSELDTTLETALNTQLETIISDKFASLSSAFSIISSSTLDTLASQISTYLSAQAVSKFDITIDDIKTLALESIFNQLGLDTGLLDPDSRDIIAENMVQDLYDRLSMDEDIQDIVTLTYAIDGDVITTIFDENGINITSTLNLSDTTVTIDSDGSYKVSNPDFELMNTLYEVKVEFDYVVNDGEVNSEAQTVTLDISLADATVSDGHIAGALVFEDINNNKVFDEGETFTYTNENGDFNTNLFAGSTSTLVAIGGNDISTGLAFEGILTAPAGSTVLSPLTTLIQALMESDETLTLEDASTKVSTALGIDSSIDLTTYDSYGIATDENATEAEKASANEVQKVAVQILNIINLTSAEISSDRYPEDVAAKDTFTEIAKIIATNTILDLANNDTVTTIISNSGVSEESLENIANSITNINLAMANSQTVDELAQIQYFAETVEIEIQDTGTVSNVKTAEEISAQASTIIVNKLPTLELINSFTTDEDIVQSITFAASDTDGTASTTAFANNGTIEINGSNIIYTPNENYNGIDTISVKTTDDDGAYVMKTIAVTIASVNDIPTLEVVSIASVDEDGKLEVSFSTFDVEGSVTTNLSALNGTVEIQDSKIVYTPIANFNGIDTIIVTVTDSNGETVVKNIEVTINDINDAPILEVVSTATLDEDGSKTITFTANDIDGTITTIASAENGTVQINANEITYIPNENYNGSDTITIKTTDDDGSIIVKEVSITVTDVNDIPTLSITKDVIFMKEGESTTFEYTDFDVDGTIITTITSLNGTIEIDGSEVRYTPNVDYTGTDTITVKTVDNDGAEVIKTIDVTVDSLPVLAISESQIVNEGDSATYTLSLSKASDTDTVLSLNLSSTLADENDYEELTVSTIIIPAGETQVEVTLNTLLDEISESIENIQLTANVISGDIKNNEVSSILSISDNNGLPNIIVGDAVINESESEVLIKVSLTNESSQIVSVDYITQDLTTSAGNDYTQSSGTITFEAFETVKYISVSILDDNLFELSESFEVILSNASNAQIADEQSITTIVDNDFTSINDSVTVFEDNSINIDVLSNDTNNGLSDLKITELSQTENGEVSINDDGTIKYTPNKDFNGQDTFTYTISDGITDSTSTVTVTVDPVNDAPVAEITNATIIENESETLVQNEIVVNGLNTTSVDQWFFTHNGGALTIDVLTEQGAYNSESLLDEYNDLNNSGKNESLDSYIYLFEKSEDGSLKLVTSNDDSISGLDSYLEFTDLLSGEYMLAIGNYDLSEENALLGTNDYEQELYYDGVTVDGVGTYQITFTGDMEITQSPLASNVVLEDRLYNGLVVASDIDGDTLTYSIVGNTPAGLIFNEDGTYILDTSLEEYNSYIGETTTATFQWIATDTSGETTEVQTKTITVIGLSEAPIAYSQENSYEDSNVGEIFGFLPGAYITALTNQITIEPSSYSLAFDLVSGMEDVTITINKPIYTPEQVVTLQNGMYSSVAFSMGILAIDTSSDSITFGDNIQIVFAEKLYVLETQLNEVMNSGLSLFDLPAAVATVILDNFNLNITQTELTDYIATHYQALSNSSTSAFDKVNLVIDAFDLDITEVVFDNLPNSLLTAIATFENSLFNIDDSVALENIDIQVLIQSAFISSSLSLSDLPVPEISPFDTLTEEIQNYLVNLTPADFANQETLYNDLVGFLDSIVSTTTTITDAIYAEVLTALSEIATSLTTQVNANIDDYISQVVQNFVSSLVQVDNTINYTVLSATLLAQINAVLPETTISLGLNITSEEFANTYLSDFGDLGNISTLDSRLEIAQNLLSDLETRVTMDEDFQDIGSLTYYLDENLSVSAIAVSEDGELYDLDLSVYVNNDGSYGIYGDDLSSVNPENDIQVSFNYYVEDQTGLTSDSRNVTVDIDLTDSYATSEGEELDMGTLLANTSGLDELNIIAGEHILSNFTLEEFITLTDEDNTLRILGDDADSISLDSTQNWTQVMNSDGTTPYSDSDGFYVYTTTNSDETLRLLIEDTITVENV